MERWYRLSTYEGKKWGRNTALKAKTSRQRASFIHSMSDGKLIMYMGCPKKMAENFSEQTTREVCVDDLSDMEIRFA